MSKQPPIARRDLIRVLTEASLFVHKDTDLPSINSVRLEATGTHLLAVGTDRFTLGVSSAPYEGTPFAITLRMPAVNLVLGACKLKKGAARGLLDFADLRVTPKGTLLHVTIDETVVTVPTFNDEGWQYPDWRKLLGSPTDDVAEVPGTIGINPEYLSKLGKIGRQAKFYLRGPSKPVMARIGENFVGVVMPIRLPDDSHKVWALPEWLGESAALKRAS